MKRAWQQSDNILLFRLVASSGSYSPNPVLSFSRQFKSDITFDLAKRNLAYCLILQELPIWCSLKSRISLKSWSMLEHQAWFFTIGVRHWRAKLEWTCGSENTENPFKILKTVQDTQPLISEMSQFVLCKHANMLKCGDIVEMMINFWTVC